MTLIGIRAVSHDDDAPTVSPSPFIRDAAPHVGAELYRGKARNKMGTPFGRNPRQLSANHPGFARSP